MSATTPARIAAVVPGQQADFDSLIADFAQQLISSGWRIFGLVQQTTCDVQCDIMLISLSDGQQFPITQDLGAGSTACRLNPAALTEAGNVFRRIGKDTADLVIFNRFGKLETEGQGFAAEMLDLMSRDIPVLTIVQDKYLDDWRHFTGDLSCELAAEHSALEDWFDSLHT